MNDAYCFGWFDESKCYVCKFNCKQQCMNLSYNVSGLAERPYNVTIAVEDQHTGSKIFQSPKRNSKCPICNTMVNQLRLFKYSKKHDKVKYMCEECGRKVSESRK